MSSTTRDLIILDYVLYAARERKWVKCSSAMNVLLKIDVFGRRIYVTLVDGLKGEVACERCSAVRKGSK